MFICNGEKSFSGGAGDSRSDHVGDEEVESAPPLATGEMKGNSTRREGAMVSVTVKGGLRAGWEGEVLHACTLLRLLWRPQLPSSCLDESPH